MLRFKLFMLNLVSVKKKIYLVTAFVLLCITGYLVYPAAERYFVRPYLTVVGGIKMADGLGRQSVELIDQFKDEFAVSLVSTYVDDWRDVPEKVRKIAEKKYQNLGSIIICQEPLGHSYKKLKSKVQPDQIRIAYSMFESTRIPPDWVERLNEYFDAVVVPDLFLVDVYLQSGVKIPVFEIPLGRDLQLFLDRPLKARSGSPFTFGCLGAGLGRKNHLMIIRAFNRAFGDRSDVRLVINCRISDPPVKEAILSEIEKTQARNIEFTEFSLDNLAYVELLEMIDCYVSLSKGEGFSIQPREAMALGIPAIVTDNTAQHTICESGLVKVVPSFEKELAIYEWRPKTSFGYFFRCSEDDVVDSMLDVYENYDIYLAQGARARQWASQYHFSKLHPLYRSLIQPKSVILGTEDRITPDCLMTKSPSLYHKYLKISKKVRNTDIAARHFFSTQSRANENRLILHSK